MLMKMRNLLSLLMVISFIMIIFFSALFLSMELGHQHDSSGEDCPICSTIEECLNNLRYCGCAVAFIIVTGIVHQYIAEKIKKYKEVVPENSLVLERVRLNN